MNLEVADSILFYILQAYAAVMAIYWVAKAKHRELAIQALADAAVASTYLLFAIVIILLEAFVWS